jgi:hypothetical protein
MVTILARMKDARYDRPRFTVYKNTRGRIQESARMNVLLPTAVGHSLVSRRSKGTYFRYTSTRRTICSSDPIKDAVDASSV